MNLCGGSVEVLGQQEVQRRTSGPNPCQQGRGNGPAHRRQDASTYTGCGDCRVKEHLANRFRIVGAHSPDRTDHDLTPGVVVDGDVEVSAIIIERSDQLLGDVDEHHLQSGLTENLTQQPASDVPCPEDDCRPHRNLTSHPGGPTTGGAIPDRTEERPGVS